MLGYIIILTNIVQLQNDNEWNIFLVNISFSVELFFSSLFNFPTGCPPTRLTFTSYYVPAIFVKRSIGSSFDRVGDILMINYMLTMIFDDFNYLK